jgi:DNA repair exonuclease SbcCD ATPase subunit
MSSDDARSRTADPLTAARRRLHHMQGKREELVKQRDRLQERIDSTDAFLAIADAVTDALEQLSNDVFQRELNVIESTLTKALQEVLDQPVVFRATATFKRDAASVEFSVERDGNPEDIMRGQGGSVANIVSVGLRMFAITTLDPRRHRKFLVLDEQDCWLHPDLVPRLVRIVHEAGAALGFQVLMISHHDVNSFVRHADRVYRLSPDRGEGVQIEAVLDESTAGSSPSIPSR